MNRILPAEWAEHNAILIAWPHKDTDWAYMLEEAQKCFTEIIVSISRYEKVIVVAPDVTEPMSRLCDAEPGRVVYVECPTNDTWARDFGPITITDDNGDREALDFKFNGWGLKFAADKDNLITTNLVKAGIINPKEYRNRLNFVLEGGSIESDGEGSIMTTSRCLLSLNRNGEYTKLGIEKYLLEQTGAKRMLWLDHGAIAGDDTDSHIDTLARLIPGKRIVYVSAPADTTDVDYNELKAMEEELKATGYELTALPYAGPLHDADGNRVPATYANFLITPKAVFVPTYNLDTDAQALATIAALMPDREVIGIDCRALIQQHGSLHCVTMQLYL